MGVINKQTLNYSSRFGPSFTYWHDRWYMAISRWVDWKNSNSVTLISSGDGVNWDQNLSGVAWTIASPSLTVCDDKIWLAYTETESSRVSVASSKDASLWEYHGTNETSPGGPSIGVSYGKLILAWIGTDQDDQLNAMDSTDGINWTAKATTADAAKPTCEPGNAVGWLDGTVLAGATYPENRLSLYTYMDNPAGIAPSRLPQDQAFGGLSCAVGASNSLYISWTGTDDDHHLNYARFVDGELKGKVVLEETGIGCMAIDGAQERLLVAWTGTDKGNHINVGGLALI